MFRTHPLFSARINVPAALASVTARNRWEKDNSIDKIWGDDYSLGIDHLDFAYYAKKMASKDKNIEISIDNSRSNLFIVDKDGQGSMISLHDLNTYYSVVPLKDVLVLPKTVELSTGS